MDKEDHAERIGKVTGGGKEKVEEEEIAEHLDPKKPLPFDPFYEVEIEKVHNGKEEAECQKVGKCPVGKKVEFGDSNEGGDGRSQGGVETQGDEPAVEFFHSTSGEGIWGEGRDGVEKGKESLQASLNHGKGSRIRIPE
jgi:hypothetical protein